jgi:hypothetical protein
MNYHWTPTNASLPWHGIPKLLLLILSPLFPDTKYTMNQWRECTLCSVMSRNLMIWSQHLYHTIPGENFIIMTESSVLKGNNTCWLPMHCALHSWWWRCHCDSLLLTTDFLLHSAPWSSPLPPGNCDAAVKWSTLTSEELSVVLSYSAFNFCENGQETNFCYLFHTSRVEALRPT